MWNKTIQRYCNHCKGSIVEGFIIKTDVFVLFFCYRSFNLSGKWVLRCFAFLHVTCLCCHVTSDPIHAIKLELNSFNQRLHEQAVYKKNSRIERTISCFEFVLKIIFVFLPERKFHFIYINAYSLDNKEALFFLSNHRQTRP